MLNVKYDIVGSFLRPGEIKKARQKYVDGNSSLEELRKIEDEATRELVSTEASHGLEFVTDGEFRRRWWHLDWLKEFDGFTTKHLDKEHNGVVNHIELGYIAGKISYSQRRVYPETEAFGLFPCEAERYPGATTKKCISGLNMMLVDNYLQMGIKEVPCYDSNINASIEDIALAYQDVIKDLYEHGCRYPQIDDTSRTYMVDEKSLKKVEPLGYKKSEMPEWLKRVFTRALEGRSADMVIATHFCKGNFKGNPLSPGFYDPAASIISQVSYDGFFVEYDDERSGSFELWSILKGTGATFVTGLTSTKNPALESYGEIKRRYVKVKEAVGANIVLSPRCGFASAEEGNYVDEDTQWKKIDLLVRYRDSL